jgi:hypothetical protein
MGPKNRNGLNITLGSQVAIKIIDQKKYLSKRKSIKAR